MRTLAILLALAVTALVSLANASAAAGAVSVGHSGWQWDNPLPHGSSILALETAGGALYAAGDFGALLETLDVGVTFTGLATGVTDDLTTVRAFGRDSLVLAGGCTALRSDDAGASFRRLPWRREASSCRSAIVSAAFPAADVGYLLRDNGELYRSADGGASWLAMTPLPIGDGRDEQSRASDLFFTEPDVGFAASSEGIFRTSDGGFSWARVAMKDVRGLYFAGGQGFAVGPDSTLLKSSDNGLTWSTRQPAIGTSLALRSIRCNGQLACLATAERDGRLLRSVDGGETWSLVRAAAGPLLAVAFASPLRVLAAGLDGATVVSDDGGATWRSLGGSLEADRFNRLSGHPRGPVFALGGSGVLARTTAGDRHWTLVSLPTAAEIVDVSFVGDAFGLALDADGSLYESLDGGSSWTRLEGAEPAPAEALLALGGRSVLVAGPRGVRRSLDGGRSFESARRRVVRRATLFGLDRAGGSVFAYGPTALFASRDRGRTWRKLARPDHRPLAIVEFVDGRVGFALGKGGRLWRTRDRGRSWREIRATGTDGGVELAFGSAGDGYLASRDLFFARGGNRPDYVLRTSDGGLTWRPQIVSDSRSITGLVATRDPVAWLLADGNRLFSTTSGGDRGRNSALRLLPRTALRGRGRVLVRGRLRPSEGGEHVVVSMAAADPRRRTGSTDWQYKSARVARDGSFATRWTIRRTSVFVAQWTGDDERDSAGSPILKVRVRARAD